MAIGLVIGVLVSLVKRWRRAAAPERRLFAPFYAAGVVLMATLVAVVALGTAIGDELHGGVLDLAAIVCMIPLAAVPYLFLYSLVRARMFQGGAVRELVGRVSQTPRPGELRDALAEALEDSSVDLVYRLAERPALGGRRGPDGRASRRGLRPRRHPGGARRGVHRGHRARRRRWPRTARTWTRSARRPC